MRPANDILQEILEAKRKGLGSLIGVVAKPIAGVIDSAFGTDLKNCPECSERERKLNEKFPLN